MAHSLAFRSCETCNVSNYWLGYIFSDKSCSTFFGISTNFTNHYDCFSLGIILECAQAIDMRGANYWVATNTNCSTKSNIAKFEHHLVSQCAGLGN